MSQYNNIKHWYDMYNKISKRIMTITSELADYDETTPTSEYCTKNGELIALNAVRHAFLDADVLPAYVAPVVPAYCDGVEGDGYAENENGEMQIVYEEFECSRCGCVHLALGEPRWTYCPDCGAKMDLEPPMREGNE